MKYMPNEIDMITGSGGDWNVEVTFEEFPGCTYTSEIFTYVPQEDDSEQGIEDLETADLVGLEPEEEPEEEPVPEAEPSG